jgi:hypothetical protein
MRDVLLFLVAFVTTWIVLLTVALVVLRWRLQKRNRVSPAVKSPAPLTWLWMPTRPAQMHRRLQSAVAEIHLSPTRRSHPLPECSVDDLRRELEYQAVELDHHLVVVARHPRRRRRELLHSLEHQVGQVEELSVRLSRMSRPVGSVSSGWELAHQPPEVLARLAHQLDLLDAASDELAEIERAAGLVDVDAVFAPLERKPVPPPAPNFLPPPSPVPTARTATAPVTTDLSPQGRSTGGRTD